MRIWLIGAGQAGAEALRQLRKNDDLEVVVSADSDRPPAVREGVIGKVDYVEAVNSINVNTLARRIRPDLILIDSSAVGSLGRVTGGTALSQALISEIAAASDYPCLVLGG
jgi:FlaA1/EpsC-like NDP-sugar epimerase